MLNEDRGIPRPQDALYFFLKVEKVPPVQCLEVWTGGKVFFKILTNLEATFMDARTNENPLRLNEIDFRFFQDSCSESTPTGVQKNNSSFALYNNGQTVGSFYGQWSFEVFPRDDETICFTW
jgi:hypothetical protein